MVKKNLLILSSIFFIFPFSFSQEIKIPLNPKKENKWGPLSVGNKMELVYSLSEIRLKKVATGSGVYSKIIIPGNYREGEIGSPDLPSFKKLFEIPYGAEVVITIKSYMEDTFNLVDFGVEGPIYPVQPSVSKKFVKDTSKWVINNEIYSVNKYSEHPIADIEILGNFRGIKIARLTISPLQYNPVQGTLRVFNTIEMEICFKDTNILEPDDLEYRTLSPYFEPVYQGLGVESNYPDHPDLTDYPVKYLIVAPDSFKEELRPFINWKVQKGFQVVTGYLDSIGNTLTEIQNWVHEQYDSASGIGYDQKPTFLLLVGDIQHISSFSGSRTGRMTDLYYASVDGDYFPEMYYGRFSVANSNQLSAIIDKTLLYEQYLFTDATYLDRATLIAGADAVYNPSHGRPTIRYAMDNYFNPSHGFDTVYSYLSGYTGCYATIDSGIGFINYTAHGGTTGWLNPGFYNSNIANLNNEGLYPVVIGNCCQAANFGYSECFGEKWIRVENKGGIAYIGSAPDSYWDEDVYWSVGAFATVGDGNTPSFEETTLGAYDAPFVSDYVTLGAMMFTGNLAVTEADLQNYPGESSPEYYWQAYNLLGDPSLTPYFTQGGLNEVNHIEYYPKGISHFDVYALAGSYIGISKDSILLGAAFVDSAGMANIPVQETSDDGNVTITVTKPQYQPYIHALPVIYPEGPYIHLKEYSINDSVGGNNNKRVDYGELIYLDITLKNLGKQPTTNNVLAGIHVQDPFIELADSSENCGVIDTADGLDRVEIENAFAFRINNSISDQYKIIFTFNATDGDSIWESRFTITVNAPVLGAGPILVNDSTYGNGDGILDPGELASLVLEVKNRGNSSVSGIIVNMGSLDSLLSILTLTDSLAQLPENTGDFISFNVEVSSDAPVNYYVPVSILIRAGDSGQYVLADTQDIVLNQTPVYKMSNKKVNACRGWFYDSGGEEYNYTNSENLVMTFLPCYQGQAVAFDFNKFGTEAGYDFLYVYNGSNTTAPQISGSPFTSVNSPGYIVADNEEGSLTFRFTSDGNTTNAGWIAAIECIDPALIPGCTSNIYPPDDTSAIIPMVELTWDYSPGALRYYIYFDTLENPSFYDSTSHNSIQIAQVLKPLTDYYWKVVPMNRAGMASDCEIWTFTTGFPAYLHTNDTVTTCDAYYYDAGGAFNNYSNNENYTQVFLPESPDQRVRIEFSGFNTESGYDRLYIYDSTNIFGQQVSGSPFSGTSSPGLVTGYNEEGAITLRFTSDNSITRYGWQARISCIPVLLSVKAVASSIHIFKGDTVQLTALAEGGYEPYTFRWSSFPLDSSMADTLVYNPLVCPKQNTKYTISVDDADTVVYSSILIKVSDYVPPVVTPTCSADTIVRGNTLHLNGIITGGSGNYQYLWRANPHDPSMKDSTSLAIEVMPDTTTLYTLIVDDDYTIQDSTIQIVIMDPSLEVTVMERKWDICLGDTLKLEVLITGGYGGHEWVWTSHPDDPSLRDSLKDNPVVKPSQSTCYIIQASDRFEVILDSIMVEVHALPPQPYISIYQDSMICSDFLGENRWYLNDSLLPATDANILEPDALGLYYSVAVNNGCRSIPSNVINFNYPTNIHPYFADAPSIQIFPNPCRSNCTIQPDNISSTVIYSVKIYDMLGNMVFNNNSINAPRYLLNPGSLAQGMYIFQIVSDKTYYKRIILE